MTEQTKTPRTWNDGWRCNECCTGDRCDDPSHYDRHNCPHCHGTGSAIWNMYSKEKQVKQLTRERDAAREALRDCVAALGGIGSGNVPDSARAVLEWKS